mgnify:CR=1 FL=1
MSQVIGHTESEVVELLDPDWRDHFPGIAEAAEHYQRYAAAEWAAAYDEVADSNAQTESAVTQESGA